MEFRMQFCLYVIKSIDAEYCLLSFSLQFENMIAYSIWSGVSVYIITYVYL